MDDLGFGRGVDLLGEGGEELLDLVDVDARAAALYARGERFVDLLDALVDLVEALAAARFRRDGVELGGEIFEPALQSGEGAADLG